MSKKPTNCLNKRYHKGNSLIEYAIPLGMLALAGLASAQLLTQGVPPTLAGNLNGDLQGNVIAVKAMGSDSFITPATVAATNPTTGGNTPAGTPGSVVLTLSNGSTLVMNNLATDFNGLLETSGAAGTTSTLSANMETLAAELLASGEISQAEANLIQSLAQKGHEMAGAEQFLENFAANHPNPADWDQPVTYNGVTYATPRAMGEALIGYLDPQTTAANNPLDPSYVAANGPNNITKQFVDQYNGAVSQGALSNPLVNSIVTQLSEQIVFTSDAVQHSVWQVMAPGSITPGQFNQNNYALATTINSQGICNAGGGISCI